MNETEFSEQEMTFPISHNFSFPFPHTTDSRTGVQLVLVFVCLAERLTKYRANGAGRCIVIAQNSGR